MERERERGGGAETGRDREAVASHRDGAPPGCKRLLGVADEEFETRLPRGALAQQRAVSPDSVGRNAVRQRARLVAARVPPATDACHHLGDTLVALRRPVAEELVQGRTGLVDRGFARAHDAAGRRNAEGTAVDVLESPSAQQTQDRVRGRLQRQAAIGALHANLEIANRAPGPITHVHEVQIEHADLEVTAWPEHALALGYGVAVGRFRAGDREPKHDGGEEALGEGERVREARAMDLPVVGRRWRHVRDLLL